jgi:cyclase
MTTRRAFLWQSGMAAAATLLARTGLAAQTATTDPAVQPNPTLPDQLRAAAANETIKTTKLTDTIFLLQGVGGNIVCQIGPDGKVVIDSGMATGTHKLLEALAKLDEHRLKLLVNTHWHIDHTDGNAALHLQGGAFIIAQKNTRIRLASPQYLRIYDVHFPAAPEAALPQETFADRNTLWMNNDELSLVHTPNAHTDSDIFIHFVKGNVIHTGDLWFNGMYPMIDLSSGGTINGMIQGVDAVLAKADEHTKIVPGHGALGDKAGLAAYRTMLATVADRVKKLKETGSTVEQAIAAKPTADLDAAWAKMGPLKPDTFVALVYESL